MKTTALILLVLVTIIVVGYVYYKKEKQVDTTNTDGEDYVDDTSNDHARPNKPTKV